MRRALHPVAYRSQRALARVCRRDFPVFTWRGNLIVRRKSFPEVFQPQNALTDLTAAWAAVEKSRRCDDLNQVNSGELHAKCPDADDLRRDLVIEVRVEYLDCVADRLQC
jgi:hypothetical protein